MTAPALQRYAQGQGTVLSGALYELDPRDADLAAVRLYKKQRYVLINMDGEVRPLHRVIVERMIGRPLLKSEEVDHIDHDGYNNHRSNLRVASHALNGANKSKQRNKKTSQYKGVWWHSQSERWRSLITVNGTRRCLGNYRTEEGAARAYDKAAIEAWGEYACTNFRESN